MRVKLLCWVLALATVASAPAQKSGNPRVDAVWAAVHNRMYRQSDYWWEDGDFPRCVNLLRFMFRTMPGDYEIATDLGWMLENIDRYDEAAEVYQDFYTLNPKDPEAAYPIANYYFTKKQYEKAYTILDPTLKMQPHPHPNSFRVCAHSYERAGKLQDSKRVWNMLLKLTPNDGMAKANLARVEGKIKAAGG